MNDTAQIILAIATLIPALAAAIIGLINAFRISKVAANVQVIEKATNSMKDALVKASKEASLAEGTAVGLAQGRAEGQAPARDDEPVKVEITKIPTIPKS